MTTIFGQIVLIIALAIFTVEASILFKQTDSTTCSNFKHFDKGKGSNVGGETCQNVGNGTIALYKPAQSARAELRAPGRIAIQKDKKYYISWEFMLTLTVTNNAFFQWKSYGQPMTQNFPVIIKSINGVMNVIQYQNLKGGSNVLFQKTLSANQWYSHMIAIYVSDQDQGGTVEYWFEGVQQELILHGDNKTIWPCRTFDGSEVSPKFGIYGAVGTDVTSNIRNLKIGETLEDMNYGNGSIGYDSGSIINTSRPAMTVFITILATIAVTVGISQNFYLL